MRNRESGLQNYPQLQMKSEALDEEMDRQTEDDGWTNEQTDKTGRQIRYNKEGSEGTSTNVSITKSQNLQSFKLKASKAKIEKNMQSEISDLHSKYMKNSLRQGWLGGDSAVKNTC